MNSKSRTGALFSLVLIGLVLLAASVAPLLWPVAEAGYGNVADLATHFLLPGVAILLGIALIGWNRVPIVSRSLVWGAAAGAIATIPLEVIRLAGFYWGFMPGNMPRLMGVLLLNRFALGPSTASDVAGWAWHFWNGASFGIIYVLILGTARRWVALLYALAIGTGFLVSPVVRSLGIGYFGLQYSVAFPITVYVAHIGFGFTLGFFAHRFLHSQGSPLFAGLRSIATG